MDESLRKMSGDNEIFLKSSLISCEKTEKRHKKISQVEIGSENEERVLLFLGC